jgi:hypothetical protein
MNYDNNNYNNTAATVGFEEEEDYDNEAPLLEELGELCHKTKQNTT